MSAAAAKALKSSKEKSNDGTIGAKPEKKLSTGTKNPIRMPNASVNGWKEEANWTTARPPPMTFLSVRLLSALPLPSGRRRTPPPQTLPLHVQLRLPDNRCSACAKKLKKFTTMMMTKTKTPPVSSISACWTKKKPKTAFSLQALFPTRPATSRKHCALPANSNWPESWTPFSAPQWPQEKPDCPPALPAPMPGWQIRQNMM